MPTVVQIGHGGSVPAEPGTEGSLGLALRRCGVPGGGRVNVTEGLLCSPWRVVLAFGGERAGSVFEAIQSVMITKPVNVI